MNICLICLRTNRLIKLASDVLEEFHAELCDFSTVNMTSSCYYCRECEYILTKFYKFKQKCEEALKIYQKWNSTKNKLPINLLFTLLPPSPLGMWKPNPKKIGNFTVQGTDSQTDICIENGLINNTYPREDKKESDQTYTSNSNDTLANVLKTKNISENVPELEQTNETHNDGKSEECLFDDLEKLVDNSDDSINLNVTDYDTEDSDLEQMDEIQNDGISEEHLFDNLGKLVDDSEESMNFNDTEYETEDSELEEMHEIQNDGKSEECLFDDIEKQVDDSDDSTNLNDTDYDTEDNDFEPMDEIQNDGISEESLLDNIEKQMDDSEECTNLNATQYDTGDSVLKQTAEILKDRNSKERLFGNLAKQVDDSEECINLNVTQYDTGANILKQMDEILKDHNTEERLFDNIEKLVDDSEECINLNVIQCDTGASVLKQTDEILKDRNTEERLFDNIEKQVDDSEECINLNVTQCDTGASVLKQTDEILKDRNTEERLFDNIEKQVDDSEECINLNVTQFDTGASVLEQMDEIQNDRNSEECLFDNIEKQVNDSEECTNLNVTKYDSKDSGKETKIVKSKKLTYIIKINTASKIEKIIDNLEKLVNESEQCTNLNVTEHDTKDGGKETKILKTKKLTVKRNTAKKNKNIIDNLEKLVDDSEQCTNLNVTEHDTKDSGKETKTLKTKKLTVKRNRAKKNEKIMENGKPKRRLTRKVIARIKTRLDKAKEHDKKYESVFDIEYLTTREMKLEEFQRRKTYECYVKAEHKCEICFTVCKSLSCLKNHTEKYHNETAGTICCPICKMTFKNSQKYAHNRMHLEVFKCKLCLLVTYHRTAMERHFYRHKGKQYNCEQCNTTYKSLSAYYSHLNKVHKLGRNVCERCGRGFRTSLGLSVHKHASSRCTVLKETSSEQKESPEGVRCNDCEVTLPSQEVYEAHIQDVHEMPRNARRRRCFTDSAGLPEYSGWTRNRRGNGSCIRKFMKSTCRVCNKVGTSYGWLTFHFKREHPNEDINIVYADKKTHLCDICGTGFSSVYTLRDHMTLHTGARPYACDICPKRFRNNILMQDHRQRHFPCTKICPQCGKQFKTPSNLYNHMKIHTGEKHHKCTICEKAFRHSTALTEHIRGVHYQIRRAKRGGTRTQAAHTAPGKRAKRRKIVTSEEETDSDFSSDSSE